MRRLEAERSCGLLDFTKRIHHARAMSSEHRAGYILAGIAVTEGFWVWAVAHRKPMAFLRYEGFAGGDAGALGWLLALVVFVGFTVLAARRLPSVRQTLVSLSLLKVLALAVAIAAGLCEETIFRKVVMDALREHSLALQIAASALTFGLAHGIWGAFRGSLAAAVGATVATGLLGGALGVVFVASHRVLAPAVTAHFLINALAEPGLVLAAVRGEMGQ
jgi:hypothetical protein